jgi:hypothetical protein
MPKARIDHTHLSRGLDPETFHLKLQAKHRAHGKGACCLHIATVHADVCERRPDRHVAAAFPQAGAALASITRAFAVLSAGHTCATRRGSPSSSFRGMQEIGRGRSRSLRSLGRARLL